jgi:hypothetical protein
MSILGRATQRTLSEGVSRFVAAQRGRRDAQERRRSAEKSVRCFLLAFESSFSSSSPRPVMWLASVTARLVYYRSTFS